MYVKALCLFIFFLSSFGLTAQELAIQPARFGMHRFMIDGENVNHADFKNQLARSEEALEIYRKGESLQYFAAGLSMVGGGFIGFTIGRFSQLNNSTMEPNWNLAIVGAGLIGLSFLPDSKYRKNTNRAINVYNEEYSFYNEVKKTYVDVILGENGLGVQWRF